MQLVLKNSELLWQHHIPNKNSEELIIQLRKLDEKLVNNEILLVEVATERDELTKENKNLKNEIMVRNAFKKGIITEEEINEILKEVS
jgi:hypothetical protein